MIEIVKEGTKEAPVYTRECPECGTVFKYNYSDTVLSGWNGGYCTVLCPKCKYPVAHLIAGGSDDINHPKMTDTSSSTTMD